MADFAARKRSIWDAYKFTLMSSEMLVNEMDNCNWTSTISLLQEFCHSHDYQTDSQEDGWTPSPIETRDDFSADWDAEKKTRCKQSKMIENFYMRFFNFNGSFAKVMNYYATWAPQNRNDVYLTTIAMGREFGKSTRILFDFHLTDESKDFVVQQYFLQ